VAVVVVFQRQTVKVVLERLILAVVEVVVRVHLMAALAVQA
jgi:hypothetical protein